VFLKLTCSGETDWARAGPNDLRRASAPGAASVRPCPL